jgi:DnaJ-class molecular chaperone
VAGRDPYRVLGVARGASANGIRAAYKRLAKRLHPDRAGDDSARAFRQLQEAYDLLSDPARRRRFDIHLQRKQAARRHNSDPLNRQTVAEPLIPEPQPVARGSCSSSAMIEDLFVRFTNDLNPISTRTQLFGEAIEIEVVLDSEQAAAGGVFRCELPVRAWCSRCDGSGVEWTSRCRSCRGLGWVVRRHVLLLRLPSKSPSGAVFRIASNETGGIEMRIRIRIDQDLRGPPRGRFGR